MRAVGSVSLDARLKEPAPELPLSNPWEDEHPVKLVHLRHPRHPIATIAFVDVNGQLVIQGDFGNFGKR